MQVLYLVKIPPIYSQRFQVSIKNEKRALLRWFSLSYKYKGNSRSSPTARQKRLLEAEIAMLRGANVPLKDYMVPIPQNFMHNNLSKLMRIRQCQQDLYIHTISTSSTDSTRENSTKNEKPHLLLVHGWGGGVGIWLVSA